MQFFKPRKLCCFRVCTSPIKKIYNPKHIELEKKWTLGHEMKSGRADICVSDTDCTSLLIIIECKTFGKEYEKAKTQLNHNGGQLFSYW